MRFFAEAGLERQHQRDAAEFIARRRRERELRFRGEILRAIGAARAGGAIGVDDLALPGALLVDVAGGAGDVGELLARLDGIRHRRRIGDHETLEHADGLGRVARLGVQIRGLQIGLALDVLRLGGVHRDAFEFHRGLAGLAGLADRPPRASA